jgi:long-chain-fatty-acid--CoA ligase ACSBG
MVLFFKSGTTDLPKAAMLSHDSICYIVRVVADEILCLKKFNERFVTFLPLSHTAAQVIDIFAPLHIGITIYFSQPDALKGSLAQTLKEVRPTLIFAGSC